ncbi:MAG: PAS domain S-box protein [Cyanobacteriota bacterium]|nr:PAS domain S-box protein [Cyanobacteriota bacterium]
MKRNFQRWLADATRIEFWGSRWTRGVFSPSTDRLKLQLSKQAAEISRLETALQALTGDRTEIETQLRLFESVALNIDEAVLIAKAKPLGEPGPQITYINEAFTQITGYSSEEILGKTPRILQGAKTCRLELDKIRQALEGWQPIKTELLNYRKDGSEFWVEASIIPIFDRDGTCSHFMSIHRDISDRKRTQRQLTQIRKAVESASDAIAIVDLQGRSTYHNRAFLRLFDHTPETLNAIGGWTSLFVDENIGSTILAQIARGRSWLGEAILCSLGDRKMLVSLRVDAIEDGDGSIVGLVGICTDITERRQAEMALQETQHLLEQIARTTPTPIYIFDLGQLCSVYVNRAGCEFFGMSPAAFGNMGWKFFAQALHPEDVLAFAAFEERFACLENGEVLENEFRMKNARGEWRWLHTWEVVFTRTVEGMPQKILGTAIDITERKRAERALREERNFVAAVLETAGALVSVLDCQGNIIRFNRACEQLTGYTLEEVRHRCMWDLFVIPEELSRARSIFQTLLARRDPIECEYCWQAKDGTRHLISWSNSVLLDREGAVKYIIVTGLDITERKRAEEVRLALEKERELGQLRLRFFSMASHEFRTPLSTILLSAQSLEASAQHWTPSQRLRNIHRIQSATQHMRHLIEDILTINRAETGKLEFDPRPIDLHGFARKMIREMQGDIDAKHLDPHRTIQFESVGDPRPIAVDLKLMRSILTNLLSNAVKYSPDGGEVKLAIADRPDAVTLEIIDRGIGIPEADRDRLFEAFHRGSNVDRIPGSGLGLTVVQKCVELHGGQIRVTSEEGVGTAITVRLTR